MKIRGCLLMMLHMNKSGMAGISAGVLAGFWHRFRLKLIQNRRNLKLLV